MWEGFRDVLLMIWQSRLWGVFKLTQAGYFAEKSVMIPLEQTYPNNPLVRHSVSFAISILGFCDQLNDSKRYVVSKQLLRCGTAIGSMVLEAQSAESKADFIHKLKIADKEARETWYWLYLCKHAADYPFESSLPPNLLQIQRILHAILKTGK